MNGSAEGFADYGVVIDPDRNWLASVMERAQRTINILLGASMEREKWPKGERVAGHKFYHVRRSRGDPATKLLDSIIRLFNFLASNFIVDTIFFLLLLFFEILVPIILHFYYSLKKELKEKMELREILYINGIIVY